DAENLPATVWNAGANPDRLAPSCLVFLRLLFILMSNGTSCDRPRHAFAVIRPVSVHARRAERRRICLSDELTSQYSSLQDCKSVAIARQPLEAVSRSFAAVEVRPT